ncbi:MAG: hypothetical protein QXX95_03350 [Nitrososphaerales archaeon]
MKITKRFANFTLIISGLWLILIGSFANRYFSLSSIGMGFLSILLGIAMLFVFTAYWLNIRKGYLISILLSLITLALISFSLLFFSLGILELVSLIIVGLNTLASFKLYKTRNRKERVLHPLDLPIFG